MLLDHRKIIQFGLTREVINQFLGQFSDDRENGSDPPAQERGRGIALFRARSLNRRGEVTGLFTHAEPITVSMSIKSTRW